MNRFFAIRQTCWDWRAAGNFMFGGTGSALMLMIAIASYPDTPSLPLGLVALAFIGLGLFMVWLEIGKPWRFLHVYFHPQTSWMTREASVAALLFPIAFVGVIFKIPLLITLAGLLGLLFLYCQARILLASKGIPSWRESTTLPLIISTGLVEGTSLLLLSYIFSDSIQGWAIYLLLVLLAVRGQSWIKYRQQLTTAKAPKQTLSVLNSINTLVLWPGNILPFILVGTCLLLSNFTNIFITIASVLAILSGWHMKFTIITRAAQQQGYSVGKLKRGRPVIKPPVKRKPERFVL
ncbi:MAG: phenylacetyl-CoA:acceptor oxidoreductase [Proteobacteria bacterium]|nr:phenylacetyl-CoA:acceptor oxidoreductase [Pseudomonadota bacterium]